MKFGQSSGFEDDPAGGVFVMPKCNDPDHSPPTMLVVPEGKRYRHICPKCGSATFVYPFTVFCEVKA